MPSWNENSQFSRDSNPRRCFQMAGRAQKNPEISVNVLRREEMKEEQKSSSYFFRLDFEIEMTQNIISRLMHFRPSTEDNSTEKYEIKQFLSSSRSRQNG